MNTIYKIWSLPNVEELRKNYEGIHKALDSGMSINALYNSNVYNHSPIINSIIHGQQFDYLAVTNIEDGILLRQDGITFPILITDYPYPNDTAEYVRNLHSNFLTQCVDSMDALNCIAMRVIPAYGGVVRVHLKIEISENSKGFHYFHNMENISDFISAVSLHGIFCEGLCTKFDLSNSEISITNKLEIMSELLSRIETETGKKIALNHFFIQ